MKRDSIEVLLSTWGQTLFHQPAALSLVSPLISSWSPQSGSEWTMEAEMLRADVGIRIARQASKACGNGSLDTAAKRRLLDDLGEHGWILRAMKEAGAGGSASDPVLRLAINWSNERRMSLQLTSLLLSLGASVGTVASALAVNADAVACYSELFCNVIDRRDEPLFITAMATSPECMGMTGQAYEVAWSEGLPGAAVHLPMSVTLARLGLDPGNPTGSQDADIARLSRMLCIASLEPGSVPVRSHEMRAVSERHRRNIEFRNSDESTVSRSMLDVMSEHEAMMSWTAESEFPESPESRRLHDPEGVPPPADDEPEEDVEGEPGFPVVDLSAIEAMCAEETSDEFPGWSPLAFVGGEASSPAGAGNIGWFAGAGVDRLWRLVELAGRESRLKSRIAGVLPPWIMGAADAGASGNGERSPWFGEVRRAVELHHGPATRHLLQACLICRESSVEKSAEFLRLPPAVVGAYAALFFDTGGPMDRPWLRSRVIDQLENGVDPAGNGTIHAGMKRVMRVAHHLTLEMLGDLTGCSCWMVKSQGIEVVANRLAARLHELAVSRLAVVSRPSAGGLETSEWNDGFRLLARVLPDDRESRAQGLISVAHMVMESEDYKLACEKSEEIRLAILKEDAGESSGFETGDDSYSGEDPVHMSD